MSAQAYLCGAEVCDGQKEAVVEMQRGSYLPSIAETRQPADLLWYDRVVDMNWWPSSGDSTDCIIVLLKMMVFVVICIIGFWQPPSRLGLKPHLVVVIMFSSVQNSTSHFERPSTELCGQLWILHDVVQATFLMYNSHTTAVEQILNHETLVEPT